jgi:hypothetical protein
MALMNSINEQHIKKCASAVLHTVQERLNYPPNVRLSTELIVSAASQLSGFQIFSAVIPKDAMPELRGMLVTFESGADFSAYLKGKVLNCQLDTGSIDNRPVAFILISNANNQCWARFTLVKEIAHLVLEQRDLLMPTRISSLVEAVVKLGAFTNTNDVLVNREDAGVKAAVEIFMPDSFKDWATRRINVNHEGPLQIAQLLMIPQKFVEQRLMEWGLPLTPPKQN